MAEKTKVRIDRQDTAADRHAGNNTSENQRAADQVVKGDKGKQQQGNAGSRQGEGANRGKRGNTGLG